MENIQLLLDGFQTALTLQNLLSALIGALIGLVVGAMPGIGSLSGVAMLLPLTFKLPPTTAIIGLAALYYSNMYGGSFSAILLNIPGDSPAVCTAMDGYPLSRNGKAGKALSTSTISSFVGGTIGIIILTICGPILADAGLAFGPAELALLILFALTSIGWILGDKPAAGLVATAIGVMLATIGIDKAIGHPRFAFGNPNLLSGMAFIPLVIGMFGFSQVIDMVVNRNNYKTEGVRKVTFKESVLAKDELKRILPVVGRSGIFGTLIGVLPGAGATTAAFLSYILEKRVGKNRDKMGTGVIEGVAAPEAANNAAAAGAFAPLLTLGIPGSGTAAVLLGGLMMWGLRPGPLLFSENPDFVWGLISSMYVGNVLCLIIAFACIPVMMKVVKVPSSVMIAIIPVVCIVGTYSVNNSMFDVMLMICMGIFAYFMSLASIPTAPLLLAFVLTPMLETYTRQAFDISNGGLSIFVGSKIAVTLIVCIVIFCTAPIIKKVVSRKKTTVSKELA